jgi:hypothetical protein
MQYEIVVFNDQYGTTVRCRSDIDRQSGFDRLDNGVVKHNIPEKNQVRYGYILASGPKREMNLLADSLKLLLDGLRLQTETRQMQEFVYKNFDNSFDEWKQINNKVYKSYKFGKNSVPLSQVRIETGVSRQLAKFDQLFDNVEGK